MLAVPTAIDPTSVIADITYLVGLGVIVTALWWGRAQLAPTTRGPWTSFALAATGWFAGDTIQRVMTWSGHPAGGPSWPDVFWLGSYPLLIVGVHRLIRRRGLAGKLARDILLDTIVISSAAFVAAWHVLIAPELLAGGPPVLVITGMAYPTGDIAVFALAVTLAMLPSARSVPAALLISCLGLTLPIDFLQAVVPEPVGDRLDGALLLVNGLLGAAALHPDRARLAQRRRLPAQHGMHRWRIVLLGCSLATVSFVAALPGHELVRVLPSVLASVVISSTVVLRFYRAVEEREAAEAAMTHLAQHDQLTGVANRTLLMDRLVAAVRAGPAVLVFIDLDGFKVVNDTWGHLAGDTVLRTVAQRLGGLVRGDDTVARVGGDEFVVLCRRVPPGGAQLLAARMREALVRPVLLDAGSATVGASIGLVVLDGALPPVRDDITLADELLRRADSAMYEAKRTGGGVRSAEWVAGAAG
jgi:diguanylate cyclase (GGDEF)-like protein